MDFMKKYKLYTDMSILFLQLGLWIRIETLNPVSHSNDTCIFEIKLEDSI